MLLTSAGVVFLQEHLWILLVPCLVAMLIQHRPSRALLLRSCWRWSSLQTWMALLYVLYIVGLLWSRNLDYAGFDLQVKASMLGVPLAVLAIPDDHRSGSAPLFRMFRWACALAVLLCLAVACWRFGGHWAGFRSGTVPTPPTTAYFISSGFSMFMHPSYFAMYLGLALASLDLLPGDGRRSGGRWLMIVYVVGITFCASKAGWIALALYWSWATWVHWKEVGERRFRLAIAMGGCGLLVIMAVSSPFFREKVMQFRNAMHGGPVDVSAQGSTESRELIWSAAFPLVLDHLPWGTGTGDVKDVLLARYEERGYVHAVEQRLNAHSQWLQTALTLGVPGILTLFALVLVPVVHAFRRGDRIMQVFLVLLALNWSVESMLETQAGVVFLAWGALMLSLRSSRA